MDNWIVLGIITAILLATRLLIVGEMQSLGFDGLYFFSTGSALISASYFIGNREWSRRNSPNAESSG